MAKSFGLEMQWLSPKEAGELFPIMSLEDVRSRRLYPIRRLYRSLRRLPGFGQGRQGQGRHLRRRRTRDRLKIENRAVKAVETDKGTWTCNLVVNCAGMWGHEIGRLAGVRVPSFAVEHQYLITDPIPDMPKRMPTSATRII